MKKFLAILLAMMLVMVSVAAVADDGDPETNSDPYAHVPLHRAMTEEKTITIKKAYTVATTGAETPEHVVNFSVVGSISNITSWDVEEADDPLIGKPSVDSTVTVPTVTLGANKDNKLTVGKGKTEIELIINLPSYDRVGIYQYDITEIPEVAGVVYNSYTMRVTVVDQNGLSIAGIALRKNNEGNKTDTIVNSFEAGQLTVAKTVTGNLGDKKKDFNFTVTFSAPEGKTVNSVIYIAKKAQGQTDYAAKTEAVAAVKDGWTGSKEAKFTLKDTESVVFTNIPNGVTWVVSEDSYAADGYSTTSSGDISNTGISADGQQKSASFTNNKETTPDTGITLETLPYVLMMALAMMGLVALKLRKREEY